MKMKNTKWRKIKKFFNKRFCNVSHKFKNYSFKLKSKIVNKNKTSLLKLKCVIIVQINKYNLAHHLQFNMIFMISQ